MAKGLLRNQTEAIRHFIGDKKNGEAWRRVLFQAPAYAMERIAISMYYSVYGKQMSREEKEAYRALREEIEATLRRKDLEYLIKVMPASKKPHYRALLSVLPQEETPQQQAVPPTQESAQPQAAVA